MRDQVIMFPNGNLGVAIPLFRNHVMDDQSAGPKVMMLVCEERPLAYAIDWSETDAVQFVDAEFIEEQCEFLGEL